MPKAPDHVPLPASIVLPGHRRYVCHLFRIESRDEQGRPENCVMIPDDRMVELNGDDEFFTAYVMDRVARGTL